MKPARSVATTTAKRWALARRDLLKGLGLGAAFLPLLRAPRAGAQPVVPKKLVCVLGIQGYRQQQWKPAQGSLLDTTLPSSSAPLEPHKSDLIFATDLTSQGAAGGNAGYSTVFYGLGSTGAGQWRQPTGKTLDQVVADAGVAPPAIRSSFAFGVQLDGMPRATPDPGGNYAFWRGPGQPVVPVLDPAAAYMALFGEAGTDPEVRRLLVQRKSVLDYVGGSLGRFSTRVGTDDRRIIDAHLASLRELERSIGRVSVALCASRPPALDLADPNRYAEILEAQTDLMVSALSCGVTRVTTLQLADAHGYSLNFGAFVPGIPARSGTMYKTPYRNWADLAHNPVMGGVDQKAIVDKWWMSRLAALITRMKAVADAEGGNLFDNSVIVWANPVDDGGLKGSQRMPWLIAARAGGTLKTGQHVAGLTSKSVMAAVCRHIKVDHPFGDPAPSLLA